MKKHLSILLCLLFFTRIGVMRNIEIIEVPPWVSNFINPQEEEFIIGQSDPENRTIILYTKGLCEYYRHFIFYHELYHVEYGESEEEADAFARRRTKVKYDCEIL